MSASTSEEKLRRKQYLQKKNDPRMYMRYSWIHPNRPPDKYDFRTDEGEPIRYLADDEGPLNADNWADINILMMARGCLKTTSVLGATTWAVDMYPNTSAFMTAPRQSQVAEFMDKFKNAVENIDGLKERRVRDRQSHQKFETQMQGEHDETYTVHSHLKSKSAWDADEGLRGPHCHLGIIDEFQDVNEEAFSVFLEVIDQSVPDVSHFPTIFLIGTPKLKNTFFHNIWLRSNQSSWDSEAQNWVDESDVGAYTPPKTCENCGVEQNPTDGVCKECGSDIPLDDGELFTIKGWHISQEDSPLHSPGAISFKRDDYPEKKFANEVLAKFYSPEDDLLTEDHVKAIYDDERGFRHSRQRGDSFVAITVDWGGGSDENASDTVITVGENVTAADPDSDPQIDVIKHEFVDQSLTGAQEEELVADYIREFDADIAGVDEGYNGTRRLSLQEEFGHDRVIGIGYGNVTPSEDVKWRENESERRSLVTVDKTYSAESMVDYIKDERFVLPKQDLAFGGKRANGSKLLSQLTATYKEHDEIPSGKKKLKIMSDRRDDAFDTWVFQYLCHDKLQEGHSLSVVSTNTMI